MTLIRQGKKVILPFGNFASFPTTGNLNNFYFDQATGEMYYWNGTEYVPVGGETYRELNQLHVDKNGNDTIGNGADENPYLTITKALSVAPQADAVIVTEGTYAEAVTIATQNLTLRGEGNEYGGLTEINSLGVTANGTSVRASAITILGNANHSGSAPFYLTESTINGNYVSSSAAYSEIRHSRIQSGTIGKTAAGILYITDSLIGNANFATANSVISMHNVTIDPGKSVTIGAGVIYSLQDVVGNVIINAAAIPLETALLAQGLNPLASKLQETSTFNDIRLTNVPTITGATKALVRDTNGIVSEQTLPSGGVSFGTAAPSTAGTKGDVYYKTTNGTSAGSVLETYTYDGTSWVLVSHNEYTKITSLIPKVYQGAGYVNAQANVIANVADAFLLSDGTYINAGRIKITGHSYTIGNWYYLSQGTAGAVTDTYPLSGIVQQLFFVEDANTLLINIEQAIDPNTPTYANLVYVNNTNVNSGTIFDLNNPPTTNNNALKNDVGNLYIGTDGSTWIWNGTAYVTKTFASTTEWYIAGTTVDAQGDKVNKIARAGWVTIGKNLAPMSPLDVYNSGTATYSVLGRFLNPDNKISGNNTQLIFGAAQESGNAADWRFYYAGNNSGFNRIDFAFSGYAAPNISYLVNGRTGIRQTNPNSTLHLNGSLALPAAMSPGAVTLTENNFTYIFSSPGTAITLPSATGIDGRIYVIKNSSGGNITLTGSIESSTSNTITIPTKGSRMVQAYGGQWFIIAAYL